MTPHVGRPHPSHPNLRRVCASIILVFLGIVGVRAADSINPAPTSKPAADTSNLLTVAFWNIQWFPGGRPNASATAEKKQTTSVHADMKRLNPDIIGMEEVRNWQMAQLAVQPLTGMKIDVCANFPPREGQSEAQEVAIASRLQPVSAWVEEWKPAGPATPPRGFAFAAYQPRPGKLLLVYCVHFKSNRGEISENVPIREEAARQLLSHIAAMKSAYAGMGDASWIIGGDFNTSLDDPRFNSENTLRHLLKNGFSWIWQNVPAASRMTLHGDANFPPASFDHIFYRGLTLRNAQVIPTTRQSSDHKPIVAKFEL